MTSQEINEFIDRARLYFEYNEAPDYREKYITRTKFVMYKDGNMSGYSHDQYSRIITDYSIANTDIIMFNLIS
jgi:hypothetical protein